MVLLAGLVILAPTMASTGAVRSIVVGIVNRNLNGRLEIGKWSLGWSSPISISGVRVYDSQKRLILDVPRIKLGISLLGAARQNFALGNNVVDIASFDLRVDENGNSNFETLAKPSPPARSKPAASVKANNAPPPKLPAVSGKFTVNFRGTVEAAGVPPVYVDASTATIKISNINRPVENSLELTYRIGETESSTIQVSGVVSAITKSVVQIDKFETTQQITLNSINLAAAEPFLKTLGPDTRLRGVASGSLNVQVAGLGTGLSASGGIVVDDVLFGGGPLAGDQFQTSRITIPISVKREVGEQEKTGSIKIEKIAIEMPQATLAIAGHLTEQSLMNLAAQKAPGSDGSISVKADIIDLPNLARQLPNTLHVDKGVQVSSGAVHSDLNVTLSADRVVVAGKLGASAEGVRDGKPIKLLPITANFGVSALPTGKPIPDVRDMTLGFNSDFATIEGGGTSLAKIDVKGDFNLDRLRAQISQFVDLGNLDMQGNGRLAVNTEGNVTDPNAPVEIRANISVENAKVTGVSSQNIEQDRLALAFAGKILRKDNAPTGLDSGILTVTSGDPASPALDLELDTSVDLTNPTTIKVPQWEIKKFDISDLARLQAQYGGLVPALAEQQIKIESGGLHLRGAGAFDGTTAQLSKPLELSIPSLTITKQGRPIVSRDAVRASLGGSVMLATDNMSANLTQLSFGTDSRLVSINNASNSPLKLSILSAGAIQADGAVSFSADLRKLVAIGEAYSGQAAPADQPQLRSGQFNGTLRFARADLTSIDFNGAIAGLTISANGKNTIDNEQLTFALSAKAPSNPTSDSVIAASAKINSSFADVTVSDVKVAPQAAGMFDVLQGANVDVNIPDIPKLYALAMAAGGGAASSGPGGARPGPASKTPPEPPLQITSGSAGIGIRLTRDSAQKTTTINLANAQVNRLKLRKGTREYAFDPQRPISAKLLAAAANIENAIKSMQVQALSADMGIVRLDMSDPIIVSELDGPQPNLKGAIKVVGSIDAVTPLLAFLQGANPLPYSGNYQISEQLATNGNVTSLSGSIDVSHFKVLADNRRDVVFAEEQIAIRNDLAVDVVSNVASVNTLALDMPATQAAGVKFSGKVSDWAKTRTISGVYSDAARLDVSYDLEKLWTIARPMLSPEMQQQYKDVKIKGKYSKVFTLAGSYPDKPTPIESLMSLNVDGSLAVERLELPQGLILRAFDLPFRVSKDRVEVLAAPDSAERRVQPAPRRIPSGGAGVATTAICNDGALNLDGIIVDLSKPSPLVSIPARHVILQDVRLNSVLASSLGKMGALILNDAKKAEGVLTLTVDDFQAVPVAEITSPTSKARVQVTLAVDDLFLDGPVLTVLSAAADLGTGGVRGSIPPSTVKIHDGQAETDLTLLIDRSNAGQSQGMPIRLRGGMGFARQDLRNFVVEISPDLLIREVRKVAPNGAVIPLEGTASKPRLDVAKFIRENAIKSLIGGRGANPAGQGQGQSQNPLGGVLRGLP